MILLNPGIMVRKTFRILFFGDSITYGMGHDHIGVDPLKIWPALVDYELNKYEKKGIFTFSAIQANNGDTTRIALERLNEATSFRPYLVTIQCGYNDCNYWVSDNGFPRVNIVSYEHNLIELINKFLSAGVKKIIISTNHLMPINKMLMNGKSWNTNVKEYNKIVRKVAQNTHVDLCDIELLFGERDKSFFLDENGKWLHLSEKGNKIYAENILPYIKSALNI